MFGIYSHLKKSRWKGSVPQLIWDFSYSGVVAVAVMVFAWAAASMIWESLFSGFLAVAEARQPVQLDPMRDQIATNTERIIELQRRLKGLDDIKIGERLGLMESALETQGWFLRAILAAIIPQLLSYLGRLSARGQSKSEKGKSND